MPNSKGLFMFIGDTLIPGVSIWKIAGKKDKFLVKKGNTVFYIRDGAWREFTGTAEQLGSVAMYRFSSYANKNFQKYKEDIFNFILYNFTTKKAC